MIAYKGFNWDLACTMGKGTFRYEPGKWYREDKAHCAKDGFHATDNPLDVLVYYDKPGDRYFIVELRGNIDEDGYNSRISAPEIRLRREITKDQLYKEGVIWMAAHPKAPLSKVVKSDVGDAFGRGNVIVRGRNPKARGSKGDNLYIVKENQLGNIVAIGAFTVGKGKILPEKYYDVEGRCVK